MRPYRRQSRRLAHQLVEGIGAQIQGQLLKPGASADGIRDHAFLGVERTVGARGAVAAAGSRFGRRPGTESAPSCWSHGRVKVRHRSSDIATAGTSWRSWNCASAWKPSPHAGRQAAQRCPTGRDARGARCFEANVGGDGDAVTPDFRFSPAIANGNGPIAHFSSPHPMSPLGCHAHPRARDQLVAGAQDDPAALILFPRSIASTRRFIRAHRTPVRRSARAAMRIHLTTAGTLRRSQEVDFMLAPGSIAIQIL